MKTITCIRFLIYILIVYTIPGCTELIVNPAASNKNMEDFEAAWKRINDVYPFLEFKNINWDSVYTVYYTKVEEAKGDEFYFVLHDLLAELKDGHVYYHTNGGAEVYPFYPARHYKDRHAYSPFVVRTYFDKELKVTGSRSAEYEILPENIGYIFLSNFGDDYLFNEFPPIMLFMLNTKGLIIDIRQKRGGNTLNVWAVLKCFVTDSLPFPEIGFLGEIVDPDIIVPDEIISYTKPVVVLVNGSTYSAGELTTEMLKQLSNVTAIGDTTGGGGGAGNSQGPTKSAFTLPSGKLISTPTGYIKRYDGQYYEWNGVPPDIYVEQTEADILNGRDRILECAINMLK